jgi:hypothetical protein
MEVERRLLVGGRRSSTVAMSGSTERVRRVVGHFPPRRAANSQIGRPVGTPGVFR